MNEIRQILDKAASLLEESQEKGYWMIRTDNGSNYDTFIDNGFVALSYKGADTSFLREVSEFTNPSSRIRKLKEIIKSNPSLNQRICEDAAPLTIGLRASQIYKFVYELKENDIVIIPSEGAHTISIGYIVNDELLKDTQYGGFAFAKRVNWIKHIPKRILDPGLYRALGAHQAISDISDYRPFIERNYNSVFSSDGEFNFVITINSEKVNAVAFTQFLASVVTCCKELNETYGLQLDMESLNISTYLNSPGKFNFMGNKNTVALIIAVSLALGGGSIKYKDFELENNGVFKPIVDVVNNYIQTQAETEVKKEQVRQYFKQLDVKSVEEWNGMLDEALQDEQPE